MTHLILFKTKNENELDEIAEEVAGEIDKKTFIKLYHEAIKEKFDFLFIDLHKKDNHPSMFRRNFNEFLMYNENEN
jgi:predicted O-methyltransferase YrrM